MNSSSVDERASGRQRSRHTQSGAPAESRWAAIALTASSTAATPPARRESAATPVSVKVRTVVVRSGTASRGGESGRACQSETGENDVAGHVGDEDVAEGDVADGVDDAGDDGQQDEQQRQRAMTGSTPRPARPCQFGEGGQEAPGSDSSTVSSAVGTTSSRSSGIGSPLRTERP